MRSNPLVFGIGFFQLFPMKLAVIVQFRHSSRFMQLYVAISDPVTQCYTKLILSFDPQLGRMMSVVSKSACSLCEIIQCAFAECCLKCLQSTF